MQRIAVGNRVYLSQLLLNPVFLAAGALSFWPSSKMAVMFTGFCATRTMLDGVTGALLREDGFALSTLCGSPVKDLLIRFAWLHGLTHRSVVWRGHTLQVRPGTHLHVESPAQSPAVPEAVCGVIALEMPRERS